MDQSGSWGPTGLIKSEPGWTGSPVKSAHTGLPVKEESEVDKEDSE